MTEQAQGAYSARAVPLREPKGLGTDQAQLHSDGARLDDAPASSKLDDRRASEKRILVVDDDAFVGRAIGRMLASYRVTFAQSAVGALARIEAGGDFGAIICDFYMPAMNAVEFHDRVTALNAGLARRMVFVSGAAGTPEVEDFARRSGIPCLPKPFDRDELRAVVAEAVHDSAR
jgi:CheY-like chemotaxis protein